MFGSAVTGITVRTWGIQSVCSVFAISSQPQSRDTIWSLIGVWFCYHRDHCYGLMDSCNLQYVYSIKSNLITGPSVVNNWDAWFCYHRAHCYGLIDSGHTQYFGNLTSNPSTGSSVVKLEYQLRTLVDQVCVIAGPQLVSMQPVWLTNKWLCCVGWVPSESSHHDPWSLFVGQPIHPDSVWSGSTTTSGWSPACPVSFQFHSWSTYGQL